MAAIPIIATASKPILHSPDFWLPESPVHDATTGLTWFPDIPSSCIYSFSLSAGQSSLKRYPTPSPIGALFLIASDALHLLAASKTGLVKISKATGEVVSTVNTLYADDAEKAELMRVNDGVVDPRGRVWVGSMRSFGKGMPGDEGAIWRCGNDGVPVVVKERAIVPNGIAFSPCGRWAYIVETRTKVIARHSFDVDTGALGPEEKWVVFDEAVHGPGAPDGVCVDAGGDLCVLRLDGETGEVKGKVVVEGSRQVACPRFVEGGLLVTTGALVHMDPKVREECEWAGDVFWVELPGVEAGVVFEAVLDEGVLNFNLNTAELNA
ncbi:SMP-30/Gluconolaconase/LRE-like region-domain-containing protein [Geopyxis carbonaria]|nr:SMP-30/Gluconolaconase/LRE-like region-domain-containing protein [Geopyxis carbonaria]